MILGFGVGYSLSGGIFSFDKNKNILITGTSKGIGNFLAKKFLKTGNNVWGCSRKKII